MPISSKQNDFMTVHSMIKEARLQTWKQVNKTLITLYWETRDDDVVKFVMNRSMSPAMIAEYETKLINKSLLQEKLDELTALALT